MKTFFKLSLMAALSLMTGGIAQANNLSFREVWNKVHQSSAAQEGARLKAQSAERAATRAENHWLPKVYLDAKSYRTNDPGNAFFGLLQQREVGALDFAPDSMNHPQAQNFTRGALGIDLALYEGGMKQAQAEMYNHMSTATKLAAAQIQIEQYAQSGLAYGSIASLQKQRSKLTGLRNELAKLIKNYQLGQKSNPVGYSGLLGMKSLANRMTALIEQLEAQEKALYLTLKEMGVNDVVWSPDKLDARAFSAQYLTPSMNAPTSTSYGALAGTQMAQSSFRAAKAEKARYLPRVGAFAESYLFNGDRNTANGYTAGLYLQWSLFDPADNGKMEEAKLAALAAEKLNTASLQQENAERESLSQLIRALNSTLNHLDESDLLLTEQSRISSVLFKNGSINALQFVEILNRRTDLISQQLDAELNLLKTSAEKVKKSKFEIPEDATFGGQK